MNQPFKSDVQTSLKWFEANEILSNFDSSITPYVTAIMRPLGGEIYLFHSVDRKGQKDYRVDGFQWSNNGGKKPTPTSDPVLYKSYYQIMLQDKSTSNFF